jgi:putative restriction endonuclease
MKELKYYIEQFSQLRRAPGAVWTEATKKQAPHKPLLLLAVLDLIDQKVIISSFVDIQGDLNELNELFTMYWRRVVPLSQKSSIAFPFSRLHNEPFWHLVPIEGKEITSAEINNIATVSQLRTLAIGAIIEEGLFFHLNNPDGRFALRQILINTHFSLQAGAAISEQAQINMEAYKYSEELERAAQTPLVQDVISDVIYREAVRDQGFRRAVVGAYDHRCALCGVRIITTEGHTAVDAAHIQPWSVSHNDDIRNGMALCKMCHWAFDKGVMSVADDYSIVTSNQITKNPNIPGSLVTLSGRGIVPPEDKDLWPAKGYLQWHRNNVLV